MCERKIKFAMQPFSYVITHERMLVPNEHTDEGLVRMNFFWVNIGMTKKEVRDGEFLWAPLNTVDGHGNEVTPEHWSNVGEVKKGDIVFCCYEKNIHYIAEAKSNAYYSPRPLSRSFQEWEQDGCRVDVILRKICSPVHRDFAAQMFTTHFEKDTSPALFTKNGTLSQIYMAKLSRRAGLYLLEATGQTEKYQDQLIDNESAKSVVSNTARETLIQARIGQGRFRQDLIDWWGGRCALTGVANPDLIIASHIVPWSQCDNKARLDPKNGLLLAAHIDRLFDKGLISFDKAGGMLISSRLSNLERNVFGLQLGMSLRKITTEHLEYLKKHREDYFIS